jgi:hypothetical protein
MLYLLSLLLLLQRDRDAVCRREERISSPTDKIFTAQPVALIKVATVFYFGANYALRALRRNRD